MSSRCFTYFPCTIVSFATSSSEVDLGHAWKQVYLEVPTMTSNIQLHIQAAQTTGGTFRRIKHPTINSSTSSSNDYAISSGCSNSIIPIPSGFRYIKVEATGVVSFSASFTVICGD